MSTDRITVLLADDHASVRAGLKLLLDSADDIDVVAEAGDGAVAVQQVAAIRPDVVLMDARMPGTDGIEATRQIVAASSTDVLMLTTFDLDEVVFGALRAGASGFLLKSVEPARLIEAIRHVASGDGAVAPEITRRLLQAFAQTPVSEHTAAEEPHLNPDHGSHLIMDDLTPRETEVLAALGAGLSNAQIGAQLYIGVPTVKTHVSNILTKMGLRSRMQAAIAAREAGVA